MRRLAILLALGCMAAVERDPTGDLTDRDDGSDIPLPERGRVVMTDTDGPMIIVLQPIEFQSGSAQIAPSQRAMIAHVAKTLRDNRDISLVGIAGHADRNERDPDTLGMARARAVVAALQMQGVPAYRLRADTNGARQPRETAPSPEALARNRRVDFIILARAN